MPPTYYRGCWHVVSRGFLVRYRQGTALFERHLFFPNNRAVGYGLVDSPSGQAAWIMEKFWAWTDCDGHPENALSRDDMLDNVMLYWLPGTAASSARLYWESFGKANTDEVTIPVGCSLFPKDIFFSSRRWAEKKFHNIIHWNVPDSGGHFAAAEKPVAFVEELRTCFRAVR